MLSQSDKVTVTKYPALPSLCRVCNFSADAQREFIDFQLSFDYEGAVNICTFCMRNIVQALGFYTPDEVQSLMERNTELVEQCNKLKEENDKLNTGIDTVLGLRPDLVDRNLSVDESADEDSGTDEQQLTLPIESGEGDERESEGDESETSSGDVESSTSRGLEDSSLFASKPGKSSSD